MFYFYYYNKNLKLLSGFISKLVLRGTLAGGILPVEPSTGNKRWNIGAVNLPQ